MDRAIALALVAALFVSSARAATILLVTATVPVPPGSDADKTALMQSWGHVVVPIAASDTQANFDAAVAAADAAYVSEEIVSSNLGTKLRNACIGVVMDEDNVSDEFGISSTSANYSSTDTDVIDNSHYITQPFGLGVLTLAVAAQPLHTVAGTIAPGAVALTRQPASSNGSMLILEIGATLHDSGTAAGRRVYLPWGGDAFNVNDLNAAGQLVMRRAIQWAADRDACPNIVKRAFQMDGTPIASGSTLPTAVPFRFLLYFDNPSTALTDVSVRDTLDAAFGYVSGSIRYDNSPASCALATCSTIEEAAILAAAIAAPVRTDAVDGDAVSIVGSTIEAGDQSVANAQLDVAAGRVWAMVFTVTMQ